MEIPVIAYHCTHFFLNILYQVQDLHSITPDYFLEVSGAVIHPLSYQQVSWTVLRNWNVHCFLYSCLETI